MIIKDSIPRSTDTYADLMMMPTKIRISYDTYDTTTTVDYLKKKNEKQHHRTSDPTQPSMRDVRDIYRRGLRGESGPAELINEILS